MLIMSFYAYWLLQYQNLDKKLIDHNEMLKRCCTYSSFLSQKPKLEMFVPCHDNGKWFDVDTAKKTADDAYYNRESNHFKDNERFSWAITTINKAYSEAQDKCLFKDCYMDGSINNIEFDGGFLIYEDGNILLMNDVGNHVVKTLEELTHSNLHLSDKLIKKFKL